jgi:hypothetical protein
MLLAAVMAVFGIIGITKGEFKITRNRRVRRSIGQPLGVLLLVGALLSFLLGGILGIGVLIIVIIIGLAKSEPVDQSPSELQSPRDLQALSYTSYGLYSLGIILVLLGLATYSSWMIIAGGVAFAAGVGVLGYRLIRKRQLAIAQPMTAAADSPRQQVESEAKTVASEEWECGVCGAMVDANATVCPACGTQFEG